MTMLFSALMIINSMFFTDNIYSIILLAVNIFILFLLGFPLREKLDSITSRNIYLWSNVLMTTFLMWTTSSPHYALVLPVFIVIASLLVKTRTFFFISAYCIFGVAIYGVMSINNWNVVSANQPFGYWQMIDGIIIMCSAIYTAWQASRDMKFTLRSLNRETKNLTHSYSKIKGLEHFDYLTGLINKEHYETKYKYFPILK